MLERFLQPTALNTSEKYKAEPIGKIPNDYSNTMETYKPVEINDPDDNPTHILKVRFAKGEISKEEYEEMRKVLESK